MAIGIKAASSILLRTLEEASALPKSALNSPTAWLSPGYSDDLLRWLGTITQSTATIYDKAMDATYQATHIGGGSHRLFDGGHDLFGAWERVRTASADDSFTQEVAGYAQGIWKDLTTTKGLPFMTLEKADFNAWADKIADLQIPGVTKEYLYDVVSFDALEVMGAAVGVMSALFALKSEDKTRINELLGSMGMTAMVSANPLLGIVAIAVTIYAYAIKKHKLNAKAIGTGATVASVSAAIFGILGLPFVIELGLAMVITSLLRKHVLNNQELLKLALHHLKLSTRQAGDLWDALKAYAAAAKDEKNQAA